jgi:hypothetical protein
MPKTPGFAWDTTGLEPEKLLVEVTWCESFPENQLDSGSTWCFSNYGRGGHIQTQPSRGGRGWIRSDAYGIGVVGSGAAFGSLLDSPGTGFSPGAFSCPVGTKKHGEAQTGNRVKLNGGRPFLANPSAHHFGYFLSFCGMV